MSNWEGGELTNVHYTFDFVQHFQLPHHSRQKGPTYFVQLRRVQVFGVRIDGVSRQMNYVIDEDQTIGTSLHLDYVHQIINVKIYYTFCFVWSINVYF